MRVATTFFLMLLLMFVQTPAGQLLKMPLLVQHFLKHQNQQGTSVAGFIEAHYISSHTDADQSEDEELPFKANVICNLGFATIPHNVIVDFSLQFKPGKITLLPQVYQPQQHLNNIFHPPRA